MSHAPSTANTASSRRRLALRLIDAAPSRVVLDTSITRVALPNVQAGLALTEGPWRETSAKRRQERPSALWRHAHSPSHGARS